MKAIVSAQQEEGSEYRTTVLNIDVMYGAPEDASFGCAGAQAATKLAIETRHKRAYFRSICLCANN